VAMADRVKQAVSDRAVPVRRCFLHESLLYRALGWCM